MSETRDQQRHSDSTPAIAPIEGRRSRIRIARGTERAAVVVKSASLGKARVVVGGMALAIAAVAIVWFVRREHAAINVARDIQSYEALELPARETVREIPSHFLDPLYIYPIASVRGVPLPETYPSLAHWTHPVVGIARKIPILPEGHFGAERSGVLRVKCGAGHCGTDLEGPIGLRVVAVTAGTIFQIDRSRDGADGRSGRYVRIEHDDGAITSYMHLNTIAEGIEIGVRVEEGQQIGTLGRTGIHQAQPHVHFSLELPKVPGMHAREETLRYVDAAPFLVRATLIEEQPVTAP